MKAKIQITIWSLHCCVCIKSEIQSGPFTAYEGQDIPFQGRNKNWTALSKLRLVVFIHLCGWNILKCLNQTLSFFVRFVLTFLGVFYYLGDPGRYEKIGTGHETNGPNLGKTMTQKILGETHETITEWCCTIDLNRRNSFSFSYFFARYMRDHHSVSIMYY